jgi:membrane fusion protein, multidrug efflux system
MNVSPNRQFLRDQTSMLRHIRVRMEQTSLRKWVVGVAALLLVLGGYWYFTNNGTPAGGKGHALAPVRTATVQRRDMAVVEHTLGTVVANAMVQVTARVQGTLESAYFKEGQFVKKGDLLFQIDPRGFQAVLAQARATLLRDQALLKNANRDMQRYNALFAQNAISSQQRDTTAANSDALAATVAADKAAVDLAQLNLSYTQIRSPIDGKTGPLLVQPGNMVAATGTTALVTIAQLQPVKLSFDLPQADLPLIQARQKVHPLIATIDVRDSKNQPLSAPVDFTSNVVSNQSGTVELRANFDNANLSLLPGQLVNVTVELNNIANALVVPHDAVNDGPDGSYVYVVVDGRAMQRSVKILFDDSRNIAVRGDLKKGDQVIVEGQLRVVPGGPVQVFAPVNSQMKSENGAGTMPNGTNKNASGLL